jgi:sugar transferase EpsL
MLASIVIPAYNAGPHFEECLGSICAQTCRDFEVLWVDSVSTDDSLQRVRQQFPQVDVLALSFNAGYRQGCNLGAARARGKYLVICNQDVRVEPTWLAEMIACAEANPQIGIVAPLIMLHDRPELVNEAGNTLQYCGLLTSRGLGATAATFPRRETLATMSGCCFLIRRDLWARLQGFSADFDAYETGFHAGFEDVDLAWRTQLQGYQVALCPSAVMYHKFERKDTNLRLFHAYEWNRYMVLLRNYRLRSLLMLAPLLLCLELAALLVTARKGRQALGQHLRVLGWFVAHAGQIRQMRGRVQAARQVSDRTIAARMEPSVSFSRITGDAHAMRIVQGMITLVLTLYHRAFLGYLRVVERPLPPTRHGCPATPESSPAASVAKQGLPARCLTRVLDATVAGAILAACAPLLGLVALLIRWKMGGPVLFRQRRPGLHGRPFLLYKFRTMNDARGPDGQLLDDGQRLTALGRFLRHTSLDELPQLWNVMRGEMSLVGPRPLLMEYLDYYTPEQARRHEVKPGITGWAQIHGRNAITWEEKFALDGWYVAHASIGLDLRILLATVLKVARSEGISAAAHSTMPKFRPTPSVVGGPTSERKAA